MPPARTPDPLLEFGRRLFRLGQSWRREIDEAMRQFGLTDATWRPLLQLGLGGDGMRQNELAAALDIEGPSLVPLIDRLEGRGLVRRCSDAEDRRSKTIHITPDGQALFEQVLSTYRTVGARLLRDVPKADLAACLRSFARIDQALADPGRGAAR